jgi:predicted DsbA family dithiol-disulfide isomerase
MSQSTHAHRLSRKAYNMGGQQLQLPILSAIFKANLEEEKDISDENVLADLAEKVGMMSKDDVSRVIRQLVLHMRFYLFFSTFRRSTSSDQMTW